MARHDPVVMTMELLTMTEDAVLVCDGDHEGIWLPKSKVEWERVTPMFRRPELIEITMPEWLAMQRGLI